MSFNWIQREMFTSEARPKSAANRRVGEQKKQLLCEKYYKIIDF